MNKAFIIPVAKEVEGQAKLVIKGAGLSLIKPKFLVINESVASDEQAIAETTYDKIGVFGLPLFDTITFDGMSYVDFNNVTINLAPFTLDIALVEVYNPRNIILTPITGRNGTVKEYMSDGDYVIKINGSLVNPLSGVPPETLIRSLNAFCSAQTEIKVNSTVLAYLDIFSIVITGARFTQEMGARNVIHYELECLSETPFQLQS